MTSEALRLGPFKGGLNRSSDPSVVLDEELIQCLNFELDLDSSLVHRPAIQIAQQGAVDDNLLIFGSVEFTDTLYLFGTRGGATFVSSDSGVSWTELNPGVASRQCVTMEVYQNTVWLPATPGSANGGMSWTVAGGAVAVPDMPRGETCVVHKNRLYICPGPTATTNESRLEFSEAALFTTWSTSGSPGSANFIDVAQGDGTTLNNIIVYQDNLLIFKEHSTFVLAYDLDPADAILKEVNPVVGSYGIFGVTQHENVVYCLHNGNVYEIVNYNFGILNLKVPFELETSQPVNTANRYREQHISLMGDRLIVRYYNRTYSFGLRTRTWSEWRKTDTTQTIEWHIFGPLIKGFLVSTIQRYEYFTTYSFDMTDTTGYKIFRIVDSITSSDMEGFGTNIMHCIITTKDFDMADPLRYKRLFWWGADILSGNQITADTRPITLVFSPTWSQLSGFSWSQLGPWNQLLDESPQEQTIISADNIFSTGKFVKFRKSLRFRKINFSVQLISDGTDTQFARIFSFIAVVRTKQTVSKEST